MHIFKRWSIRILITGGIAGLIYLCIALGLIIFSQTADPDPEKANFSFQEILSNQKDSLPEQDHYTARDGTKLAYRYYDAGKEVDSIMILIHGSGYHSAYLRPLAQAISSNKMAHVYTPDLRGHGKQVVRRGDVDYIGQLEDDLSDFIAHLRKPHPKASLILGGHSNGAGLVVRFAGGDHEAQPEGYVLLAPYINHRVPVNRPDSSGWASPNIPRIIGLTMLNNTGITAFNHYTAIHFNMPEEARDGTETIAYSYRLQKSFSARYDYKQELTSLEEETLVLVGEDDKFFHAERFRPFFNKHVDKSRVSIVKDVNHLGVVTDSMASRVIGEWLKHHGQKP